MAGTPLELLLSIFKLLEIFSNFNAIDAVFLLNLPSP